MKYSKYPFYISQLIIKSLKGQLTEAEQEELVNNRGKSRVVSFVIPKKFG